MGLINPTPLVMTIEMNEITGTIDMKTSRPVTFTRTVRIFAAVLSQLGQQAETLEGRGGLITGNPGGGSEGGLLGGSEGGSPDGVKN